MKHSTRVALPIQMFVIFPLFFAIGTRRNHGRRPLRLNLGDKGVGVIAFIGDEKVARESLDGDLSDVARLPRSEPEAHPQSQGVDAQKLAGKAACAA